MLVYSYHCKRTCTKYLFFLHFQFLIKGGELYYYQTTTTIIKVATTYIWIFVLSLLDGTSYEYRK